MNILESMYVHIILEDIFLTSCNLLLTYYPDFIYFKVCGQVVHIADSFLKFLIVFLNNLINMYIHIILEYILKYNFSYICYYRTAELHLPIPINYLVKVIWIYRLPNLQKR